MPTLSRRATGASSGSARAGECAEKPREEGRFTHLLASGPERQGTVGRVLGWHDASCMRGWPGGQGDRSARSVLWRGVFQQGLPNVERGICALSAALVPGCWSQQMRSR
ncbi:hypothetical protein GSI_14184 [Ganoderma sinense ZZ0214-1]|uniref:Uncharacterized protein n=1 Tax=Ganoderma sinense ZZ0214-1 TaxID=1077348 RepID=A0A2G8RSE2_9APHY|nr:hypothetical protein GSI_14184 [Ganoderma sinense ZZ0214-1]